MADAKLAPNLPDWMLEHANRYLSSGGKEGHLYKMTQPGRPEITVPSLLLASKITRFDSVTLPELVTVIR